MAEGLHFASLATAVGKKNGAYWHDTRVTICAVGYHEGDRFVVATCSSNGRVVLGKPSDFTLAIAAKKIG